MITSPLTLTSISSNFASLMFLYPPRPKNLPFTVPTLTSQTTNANKIQISLSTRIKISFQSPMREASREVQADSYSFHRLLPQYNFHLANRPKLPWTIPEISKLWTPVCLFYQNIYHSFPSIKTKSSWHLKKFATLKSKSKQPGRDRVETGNTQETLNHDKTSF